MQDDGPPTPVRSIPSRRLVRGYAAASGLAGMVTVSGFIWSGRLDALLPDPQAVPMQIWGFATMLALAVVALAASVLRRSDKWCWEVVGIATMTGGLAALRTLGQLFYVLPILGPVDASATATWIAFSALLLAIGLAVATAALGWMRRLAG